MEDLTRVPNHKLGIKKRIVKRAQLANLAAGRSAATASGPLDAFFATKRGREDVHKDLLKKADLGAAGALSPFPHPPSGAQRGLAGQRAEVVLTAVGAQAAAAGAGAVSPPRPKRRTVGYTDSQRDFALGVLEIVTAREAAKARAKGSVLSRAPLQAACAELVACGWDKERTTSVMLSHFRTKRARDAGRLKLAHQRAAETGVPFERFLPRPGKPVDSIFEARVKDELIVEFFDPGNALAGVTVVSSAFSRLAVRTAAEMVQRLPEYSGNAAVQGLMLGDQWVSNWMGRNALSRRRITSDMKGSVDMPAAAAAMQQLASRVQAGSFAPEHIISADEMGDYFQLPSSHVIIPTAERRAKAPHVSKTARQTAMLAVRGNGELLPAFLILRNGATGADMSKCCVQRNAARTASAAHGDEVAPVRELWCKQVTRTIRGKERTEEYVVPFFRMWDGSVVTSNPSAWMTTPFVLMWIDLILAEALPAQPARGKKKLCLVWDNCGPHGVSVVREALEQAGVSVEFLPPNTTDLYQVCDVALNGQLKAALRQRRSIEMREHFIVWRAEHRAVAERNAERQQRFELAAREARRRHARTEAVQRPQYEQVPMWSPPAPSTGDGVRTLLLSLDDIAKPKKAASLRRCFVSLGLVPREDGRYLQVVASGGGVRNMAGEQEPDMPTHGSAAQLMMGAADVQLAVTPEGVDEALDITAARAIVLRGALPPQLPAAAVGALAAAAEFGRAAALGAGAAAPR